MLGLSIWLLVAVFYGLDYLQHTIPSVLISPLAASHHVNVVVIANIMNVYFPVYALSQIPAGYLLDRYGLKLPLSIAALIVSLGLMCMNSPLLSMLAIGRILIAMGSAFAFIGGLKAAASYLPDSIFPLMTGVLQSIGVLGGLLGQVYINYLIETLNWNNTIIGISIFGLIWAVILFVSLGASQSMFNVKASKKVERNKRNIIKEFLEIQSLQLWLLGFYAAILVGGIMSTFAETYGVILLEQVKGITSEHAAWLNSLIFVGVGVGAPLHGIIVKQFNRQSTWLIISCVIVLSIMSGMSFYLEHVDNVDLIAMLYFLIGFFTSSMLLTFSLAKKMYPAKNHGMAFAFINMLIGLGGFFVPLLFGMLLQSFQAHAIDLIHVIKYLVLPVMISLIISFLIYRREES